MASLSQIMLIGNVGKDPELQITPDGTPVTKFTIAVNRKVKNKPDETVWYNCTAWRGLAETIEKHVAKGTTLFVQGDIYPRKYTGRDGAPGISLDVTVEKFTFIGGKPASTAGGAPTINTDGLDPFLPDFPD